MTTKTDHPGWPERICYAAGGIGVRLAFGAITGYFLIYLTNVAMLDIAACSAIIGVSKVFDGISDVMIGNVIDNTDARLGKARTWLLRMCLPLALTEILLFWVPPGLPQLLKYVYAFLMYNIVGTVILTFMQISNYSMVSLISGDRKEQSILSSIQAMTRAIGALLGSVVFVRLLSAFTDEPGNQNTQTAYTRSVIALCSVMVVFVLISVFGTRERVQAAPPREKRSLIKESVSSLMMLIKNRYWAALIVCDLLINIVFQLMATGATYYSLYILNDMNKVSLILLTNLIPTILVMFAIPALTERFGNRKVFAAGLAIAIAGLMGFGLSAPSVTPILIFNVIYGLGNGLHKGTIVALIAELVVYTEETTGQLIPGMGNAGLSATDKLGNGLGSVMFGGLLAAAGFDAALKVQPAAVDNMVSMLFIWIPAIMLAAVLILFIIFFDLGKEKAE